MIVFYLFEGRIMTTPKYTRKQPDQTVKTLSVFALMLLITRADPDLLRNVDPASLRGRTSTTAAAAKSPQIPVVEKAADTRDHRSQSRSSQGPRRR